MMHFLTIDFIFNGINCFVRIGLLWFFIRKFLAKKMEISIIQEQHESQQTQVEYQSLKHDCMQIQSSIQMLHQDELDRVALFKQWQDVVHKKQEKLSHQAAVVQNNIEKAGQLRYQYLQKRLMIKKEIIPLIDQVGLELADQYASDKKLGNQYVQKVFDFLSE